MKWIYLGLAIILEVCGTTTMKLSNGLTDIKYTIIMIISYILCLASLSFALKELDVGMAYAIWAGIGITLVTIIGVFLFKENITVPKIICIVLIGLGIVGLNLVDSVN